MNYGLYLSATGVLTSSYRQDVIANNLANAETVGFKRDLALFQERLTEAQQRRVGNGYSNAMLEPLGGGLLATPTAVDTQQGDLMSTGNPLDLAIRGDGFFQVQNGKQTCLTRDGAFMTDRKGNLVLSKDSTQQVLDIKGKPIVIDPTKSLVIGEDGQITQDGDVIARIGVLEVPDRSQLNKQGGMLLGYPNLKSLRPANASLRSGFLESSNVDPATELAALMDTQRQLEANANMIRYQDQMLGKVVNEVGKI